jgi:hypothetical protein
MREYPTSAASPKKAGRAPGKTASRTIAAAKAFVAWTEGNE